MKTVNKTKFVMLLTAFIFVSLSCTNRDASAQQGSPENDKDGCYVELFDGSNFTDDRIVVKGPGQFSDLKNLPGSKKDWNDEADSFKSGKNTTVTFYTKTNFQGDSVTYSGGANKPSMDEPSSMKITCK